MTGHIWGSAKDIKYMPVDVTYSYLLSEHPKWSFRYAPELTALAMLDQPNPEAGPPTKYHQSLRQRIYGSGISPVGFRASFYPDSRVQPFLSTDGGFIYFAQRVLSPEGSQFMYTIDYGCGLTFFRKRRQTVSIGYRYQHLSNGDISMHNPGTDANTFYVSVSRFRTRVIAEHWQFIKSPHSIPPRLCVLTRRIQAAPDGCASAESTPPA